MIRVVAPSRLHFGLFHVPVAGDPWPDGLPVRCFGGVGLMVEEPAVVVVEPAADWWGRAGRRSRAGLARPIHGVVPGDTRRAGSR